jgi:hypothetical protein
MSGPAKSILAHGIYLTLLGAILVIAPNLLLGILGLPPANDVWVHVTGALTFLLGFYYIQSARKELTEFMRLTVYARITFLFFCIAFVVFGLSRPGLLGAGLLDLLGAVWTALALRSASRKA